MDHSADNLTLKKYLSLVAQKKLSPKEYLLSRIEKIKNDKKNEKKINAVIDFDEEGSLQTLQKILQ